jgi:hypothetical protein
MTVFFSRVPGLQGKFIVVTLSSDGAGLLYPLKFLHTSELGNFPHQNISLKVGVPIMLLNKTISGQGCATEPLSYLQD